MILFTVSNASVVAFSSGILISNFFSRNIFSDTIEKESTMPLEMSGVFSSTSSNLQPCDLLMDQIPNSQIQETHIRMSIYQWEANQNTRASDTTSLICWCTDVLHADTLICISIFAIRSALYVLCDTVLSSGTQSFSSVEVSPISSPHSLARRSRRMILPLRVLGSESTNSIS
jgi:hypothetical protein